MRLRIRTSVSSIHQTKDNPTTFSSIRKFSFLLQFLGRPVGERNASFGVQRFLDLDILQTLSYIKDDNIFIKVSHPLFSISISII